MVSDVWVENRPLLGSQRNIRVAACVRTRVQRAYHFQHLIFPAFVRPKLRSDEPRAVISRQKGKSFQIGDLSVQQGQSACGHVVSAEAQNLSEGKRVHEGWE